ncbi:MAG: UbiA family prenyltransferase [Gallionella sp.]|nr:UbiA family prenyltransferase [Gallionella sp.]
MSRQSTNHIEVPLCVDLDGTLVRTDLLVESWFALLKRNALLAFLAPVWLIAGKARLKHEIAHRVDLDVQSLPYDNAFLEYLQDQHRLGRQLVLTTASHEKYAKQVAEHLGIFNDVMASNGQTNFSGAEKHRLLVERFGDGGFDYAGNSRADFEIFPHARRAILVNPESGVEQAAKKFGNVENVFCHDSGGVAVYVRAMRPHQWVKNLLVFVPIAAAHEFGNLALLGQAIFAFVAFSLCASSVYLLNDLLDLPADRAHARKRSRPFASGAAYVKVGVALIPCLLAAAVGIATILPKAFLAALAAYYVSTLAYSLWLKGKVLVDVLVLAGLYTLRILAGAAAVAIAPSFWLLAFSMFLFLSLAMVKRYSELLDRTGVDKKTVAGRGYEVTDLATVQSLGAAGGYCAVLVLALYINSDDVRINYTRPEMIWLLCPLLLYWISRMWQRAGRGQMHDDPIVFALKDRVSRWVGGASLAVMLAAAWV